METPLNIHFNHQGCSLNGAPFVPLISDLIHPSCNVLSIRLPSGPENDLLWEGQRLLAQQALEQGSYIFWEIDLGIDSLKKNFYDEKIFLAHQTALKAFSETIWLDFQQRTVGVGIYRGGIDVPEHFFRHEQTVTHFKEWLNELPLPDSSSSSKFLDTLQFEHPRCETVQHCRQAFFLNVLGEYLHRLAACLPDCLNVFCLLDVSSVQSSAKLVHLLCKDRFQHLQLALKGSPLPFNVLKWETGSCYAGWIGKGSFEHSLHVSKKKIGVCVPSDEAATLGMLSELQEVFEQLEKQNLPFRVIYESFLTEEWDEIDLLIYFNKEINAKKKRKLQGFCAAGGIVAVVGGPIGLAQEVSYEEVGEIYSDLIIS